MTFAKTQAFLQILEDGVIVSDGETTMRINWNQFSPAKKQWLLHDLAKLVAREIEIWNKE